MKCLIAALLLIASTAYAQTIITADNIPCAQQPFTLYVTTDVVVDTACRYHLSDEAYESMSGAFTPAGTTTQTASMTLTCAASYTYYVRCDGDTLAVTPNALQIRFDVLSDTPVGGSSRVTSGVKKFSGGKIR